MADSFFGFNTTLPMDDDGGGELEPPEEDYDALNDETFGDAREGDWEDLHENLVRMSSKEFPSSTNKKENGSIKSEDDDDLDFSRFNFDDLDIGPDDNDIKVQLDPSVWAAPTTPHQQKNNLAGAFNNFDPNTFLRQHFSQPQTLLQQQQQQHHNNEQVMQQHNRQVQRQQQESQTIDILATLMKQAPKPQAPLKFVSVDELERNIMMQQQNKQQQQVPMLPNLSHKDPVSPSKSGISNIQPPPGMGSPRQHPMYSQVVQQQHPIMNQGGKNNRNNFPMSPQMVGPPRPPNMSLPPGPGGSSGMPRPNMPPINMPPHPMNNFNQMPFGQMRPGCPMPGFGPGMPPGMRGPPPPPGHPLSQFYNQNQQTLQNSVKQFNMKLMEEIQQNHPMLQQLNRMHGNQNHHHNNMGGQQNNSHQNGIGHHHMGGHLSNNRQMMQQYGGNNSNGNNNKHHSNGNFRQEQQDPYANLMSNRDKQWLISIQLLQLNTDTPYFDDFYFTVYKEKKAKGENRAYNNNQLNHPFNQGPKGHAHNMLLQAVANKNGMNNNNRNGMHNRERKNSESQSKGENNKETGGRNYTPLQFENSLGKLQVGCGSVTAPRKIIDMEVVSAEPINTAAIIELNTQRKSSRTLLLHIETLYKVLLLLEDLENPVAIAAAQILKQKREKERQQALEQAAITRAIAIANGESVPDISETPTLSLPSDKYPQPQTHDELIPKLLAGLTPEKVTAMMTVRKGKALLRRSMPLIKNEPHRWTVWCAIFASLNIILKKEKEVDANVIALYEEFQKHLQYAKLENVIQVSRSFITPDKKMNFLFKNKSIGLSSIVALIIHAETLYSNPNYSRSEIDEKMWEQFLTILTTHAAETKSDEYSNNSQQTMDSQVLKNIIQHLTRFSSLQTKPLLNILTQVDGNFK